MNKVVKKIPFLREAFFSKEKLWLLLVLFVSLIALSPTLFNGWVNWDDPIFITNNPLIKSLNSKSIALMFSTDQVAGSYYPLTLFSWAIDYSLDQLNARVFHTTNLILHLINVVLVYILIKKLNKRTEVALITALLFGMHLMHVEAVAWITSRKDLLFTVFYLLALIKYIKYTKTVAKKQYFFCLLFFVCSLFSKGIAFTFPIAMLTIDYFQERKLNAESLLLKAPFFVLAILFGIISISGQQKTEALTAFQDINFLQSFFVGTYATIVYLIKAVVPYNLSPFHPYTIEVGQFLPWYYYVSIIPFFALVFWSFLIRKKYGNIFFGLSFFMISIGPVLQFIPLGSTVIADRFTYLPYLGLFYILAIFAIRSFEFFKSKNKMYSTVFIAMGSMFVLSLVLQTYNQSKIWKSGETLWSQAINYYPNSYFAYACRGNYYAENNKPEKALSDYSRSIVYNPLFYETFYNRGLIYLNKREFKKALADFETTISLNKKHESSFTNLGLIYLNTNKHSKASENFQKAIELNPENALNYYNYGLLFKKEKQWKATINYYTKAILYAPKQFVLYKERGYSYGMLNNFEKAITDFSKAIEINPNNGELYYWRSIAYSDQKRYSEALNDVLIARKMNFPIQEKYINRLKKNSRQTKFN